MKIIIYSVVFAIMLDIVIFLVNLFLSRKQNNGTGETIRPQSPQDSQKGKSNESYKPQYKLWSFGLTVGVVIYLCDLISKDNISISLFSYSWSAAADAKKIPETLSMNINSTAFTILAIGFILFMSITKIVKED